MFAVIELKWHQYIVKQWDEIVVDNMNEELDSSVVLDKVLTVFDEAGTDVKVGKPYVKGASVSLKVKENVKGKKLHVIKFKRKNRYQRKIWFRAMKTVLLVEEIKS